MTNATSKNRLREFLPGNWVEFDSLLGQVLGPHVSRACVPASVWEDEAAYHVELDLPGVVREDVEITFEKSVLQIVAERKRPEEERAGLHEERGYGKAARRVTLPETIDPETIAAELKDGVLHVSVSKKPETRPKRIEVN